MWKPPQFSAPQPSSKFFPTPTQQPDLLSKANIAHVTLPNHILMQSPPSKSESVVCNNPHRPVPTFWNNLDTPQREESGSPLSTVSMVSNSPIAVPTSPTPASSHIPWFPEMNPPSSPFSPGPLATSSPKEVKPLPTSEYCT
ncbi:hypothetical protein CAPTEDRAFT_100736 [Capitella teleta]|uniref:Uncharacterized protein n=1 Tax=Capitella teleta TaxID=283909 RepID=R7UTE7_CAPTE|nr:hypothetical protein CAPTEDRAFT_100736 [Capitella teleta]|eukprot:ELU09789.1 hypothetical protein CAPTEDRAFT_100736 [Capitella teleta]